MSLAGATTDGVVSLGNVGFVGLGTMGTPMVRNLRTAGWSVTAFDANSDTLQAAVADLGVVAATEVAELAALDVVILMLPNSRIVETVLGQESNAGSLLARLRPGSIVVDMGSSNPDSTRSLAKRLRTRGSDLVDAPVSGGPRRAVTGDLTIMAGGEADSVARIRPVLDPLRSEFTHVGPVGSGHALKALNNLLSAIGLVGALEVLTVGAKFGLDPQTMLDVINTSTGRNQSTEVKIGQQVLSGDWNIGFSLPLTVKDVGTALELAQSQDIQTPVAAAAVEVCRKALDFLGTPSPDQSEIAKYLHSTTGVRLAPATSEEAR
ncbi:NAD(P)-dependent oxidoreductase [Kineococcus rhizosphaerae]|uniref:3-hydroxyisobutyrate dehydrogenase n=1 Tax=Kineococcus rhizosphaerae TaxID=559628 RepID=A0A2T0QUU5_9ACTN|nr:NAD(P)-dependent oxidoreductase [Kineococcus rhizosphaerae]PRY08940.1 3-hydroxyisobutyrate dehydrogenase [Kineococcus rhizosphaerae]